MFAEFALCKHVTRNSAFFFFFYFSFVLSFFLSFPLPAALAEFGREVRIIILPVECMSLMQG